MAKGREFADNTDNTHLKKSLYMEENTLRSVGDNGMALDRLALSSLNLEDNLDNTSYCRTSMDTSKADDIRYLITKSADDRNTERSMFTCAEVFYSTEEGYSSKNIFDKEEVSLSEKEDHGLVSSMSSSDIMNVYTQDKDGDTDLHNGIIQRLTSLVMLFISAAPNSEWLNIVNRRLQTPLHLAVITEQVNIVRRLMTGGARVDVVDIQGNTPLHIACREGYADIVQCLLQPVYYEETNVNKYDIPYQRIPQDLNKRNSDGHTFLHLAAMSTHLKVLEHLLSKGADINIGDGTSGRTILHYAAETGNRILLHFLLSQSKINISCRTFGGLTPLRLAAGRGFGDVVDILLAHGADVMDFDEADNEVIDDFCINGQPIIV